MEPIYTANFLQVFGWRLLLIFLIFAGGAGFVYQRRHSTNKERWLSYLVLAGATVVTLYFVGLTLLSFNAGPRTLTAELTIKRLVSNDDGEQYNLDFVQAQTDFNVPKRAYDLVTKGECYRVTYYHDYLDDYNPITLLIGKAYEYESSAFVAEIAPPAEPSDCE